MCLSAIIEFVFYDIVRANPTGEQKCAEWVSAEVLSHVPLLRTLLHRVHYWRSPPPVTTGMLVPSPHREFTDS